MRDVVNCEDWTIFFGVSTLWPERGKILLQENKIKAKMYVGVLEQNQKADKLKNIHTTIKLSEP
jgi:hypothetical protein